jgi:hypothetical protein
MIRRKFVSPISGLPRGTFRENGIHASSLSKAPASGKRNHRRAIEIALPSD